MKAAILGAAAVLLMACGESSSSTTSGAGGHMAHATTSSSASTGTGAGGAGSGGDGGAGGGMPCTSAADCPQPGSICESAGCSADGACVVLPMPSGPIDDPTPGDCQRPTCSAGALVMVVDDADKPADSACNVGACSNGMPSMMPKADGATCAGEPGNCKAGACVMCASAADCAVLGLLKCAMGTCGDGLCGDGDCDPQESHTTCPQDCP